jgi:hypothetical protein
MNPQRPRTPRWRRLWRMLVPAVPDFFGMLERQSENLRATVAALSDYLAANDGDRADRVHDLVAQGHALRDSNLSQLYASGSCVK